MPRLSWRLLSNRSCLAACFMVVLGEEFVNADGFLTAGAESADADEGEGPGAVVAPLAAEVALLAVGAAVNTDLPPSPAGHRRPGGVEHGVGMPGSPGSLAAGGAAVSLAAHRSERSRADRAGSRLVVVTRRGHAAACRAAW